MAGFLDRIRNTFLKEKEPEMSLEAMELERLTKKALREYELKNFADNAEKAFMRAARDAFHRNDVDQGLEIIGAGRGTLAAKDSHERSYCLALDSLAIDIEQKEIVPENKLLLMKDHVNQEISKQIVPGEIDTKYFSKAEPFIYNIMRSMEVSRDTLLKECKEMGRDEESRQAIIRVAVEASQEETAKGVIRKLQELTHGDPDEAYAAAMLLSELTERVDIDKEIDEIYHESFVDRMPLTDKAFEALRQKTEELSKDNIAKDTYDEIDLQLA